MNWTIRHALATGLMAVAVLINGCSDSVSIPELEGLDSVDELTQRRDIAQQRETLGIAKSKYLQLQQEGQRTRAALEELRGLHQRWNKEVPALLENEEGRYIAASQQDVTTFRSHFDTLEKLPESALDSMTAELDALLAPVESALNDKTVADLPDERLSTQLAALDSRLQEALAPYKLAISALESITVNARKRGELGSQTLQDALGKLVQSEADSRSAQIEAARQIANEAVAKKLAETTQALVEAKGEQERSKMETEIAQIHAQTEADRLMAKATNPDTLKRLEPFVTKGSSILEQSSRQYIWRRSEIEPLPLSFKAITLRGALEPSENGLKNLLGIALDTNNDRPAWPRPAEQKDWDWIRENQKLLKDLGPTLVELGHLAP